MQKTFPGRLVHRSLTMTAFPMAPVPWTRVTLCTRVCNSRLSPCYQEEGDFQNGYSAKVGRERRTRELYSRVKAPAQFGFVDPEDRSHIYILYTHVRALSLFSCFAFVRSFTFTSSLPQGSAARSSRPYVCEDRAGAWHMYVCVCMCAPFLESFSQKRSILSLIKLNSHLILFLLK